MGWIRSLQRKAALARLRETSDKLIEISSISNTWREDRTMGQIIHPPDALKLFVEALDELVDVALRDDWPRGFLSTVNTFCLDVSIHLDVLRGALAGKQAFQAWMKGPDT